ncbi:hypothetical protein D9758_017984 [Tetrapyrgos nigripes]|uniref:NodB homology domain-containing protein n=1 Tax=Tetrapyrgos nigripes TaxID=182062 RepID=A0A8H5F9C1_9AGAR|nr:hypothetical protein D9758_017984 [Tetrapyrgos nigripes]
MFSVSSLINLSLAAIAFAHAVEPGAKRQTLAQVITTCKEANTIALTFDDGPYIYGPDLVDLLDQNDIKGTFFYNGDNYRCIYDKDMRSNVQYAYSHGHQVGSHTWHHDDLATLTWDQIHDEMWRVEQALQRILGVNPAFMRPPYGSYNDLVLQASAVRGQKVVIWDFDDGDSTGSPPDESKADYDQLVSKHPNTVIALNHETYDTSVHDVLPYAIQKLKAAGYKFATVAECMGLDPYQSVGNPQENDVSAHSHLIALAFGCSESLRYLRSALLTGKLGLQLKRDRELGLSENSDYGY